jgi:hypothetical protein
VSATEAALRPRKLITSDRMLLAVLSVLLVSHAGLYYVCLRFNLPFALALAWSTSGFVLQLGLPESIASAIVKNFFVLVVGEAYAFILTIRFIELGTWKSPSLLSCAGAGISNLYTARYQGTNLDRLVSESGRNRARRNC